jgi:hypothetical protein
MLDFLAADIHHRPEQLQPLNWELIARITSLVGDVDIDLNMPLVFDDESCRRASDLRQTRISPDGIEVEVNMGLKGKQKTVPFMGSTSFRLPLTLPVLRCSISTSRRSVGQGKIVNLYGCKPLLSDLTSNNGCLFWKNTRVNNMPRKAT